MWVSGEGTQIVSVRYEDRYGNRGFKSILEVRRRRIQAKSWHLPSCKGLSLSGGRGSPSEGARRLQTFLALCTCLVSKQEEFLHVLPGSSDTAPHGVETSIYTSPSVWQCSPGSGCFLALPKQAFKHLARSKINEFKRQLCRSERYQLVKSPSSQSGFKTTGDLLAWRIKGCQLINN